MLIFLDTRQVLVPPSTIPPHISSTLSRPDLLLVSTDSIMLLELSVVTNTQHHFLAARNRKEDRYGSLLLDLQHAGFLVDLVTIEVGCLGHASNCYKVCHLPKSIYNTLHTSAGSSCCYLLFIQDIQLLSFCIMRCS